MINTFKPKHVQWVSLFLIATIVGAFFQFKGGDLQTSILQTKQPEPFNGTALPLLNVVNWEQLTTAEWKLPFDQIPDAKKMTLPVYNEDELKIPTSQLGWNDHDKAIRNDKIIYTTPYMWGYEGAPGGSHLAVDIKTPDFTPVYAIGNGTVVKVSTGTTGFGVHIVVKHDYFPSFDDPSKTTTYYSSYNHLSSALVAEGDIVVKGQKIALSGHSGTATTPHLHFQIDNDQAPWHPYWPFTYQEANAVGYSFDDAVTNGLGRDKALATTINPMLYVQKYLNMEALPQNNVTPASSQNSTTPQPPATSPQVSPSANNSANNAVTPPASPSPAVQPQPAADTSNHQDVSAVSSPDPSPAQLPPPPVPAVALRLETNPVFSVGVEQTIKVKALDSQGGIVSTYHPQNGVSITLELGGATFKKNYFTADDFVNGETETNFVPTSNLGLRFKAFDGDISGESDVLQGNVFKDVTGQSELGSALTFLKNYNVVSGYTDGTFRPNDPITRVEALKFIYEATRHALNQQGNSSFKDVPAKEWYTPYVLQAYEDKVVNGYPDKTFKPDKIVVKAEFLKMLYLALQVKLDLASAQSTFDDVPAKSWFAAYVADAQSKNLLSEEGNIFGSGQQMTRGEVAELMYRLIMLQISGQTKYSPDLAISQDKVTAYFGKNS